MEYIGEDLKGPPSLATAVMATKMDTDNSRRSETF